MWPKTNLIKLHIKIILIIFIDTKSYETHWNVEYISTAIWIAVNLFNVVILDVAQWLDGSQNLALAMYLGTKTASQLLVKFKSKVVLQINTVLCKKRDNLNCFPWLNCLPFV